MTNFLSPNLIYGLVEVQNQTFQIQAFGKKLGDQNGKLQFELKLVRK